MNENRTLEAPLWLRGAGAAPSAHNTQPWRFTRHEDGRIAVGWAPERTLPIGDPIGRDLYLSLGAAVENAILRAGAAGAPLHFEAAPPEIDELIGWLVPGGNVKATSPADGALAAALDRRQTARGPHQPRAVPAALRRALVAEAARHGRHLRVITDRPAVRRLASLAGDAVAALFADEAVHVELWQWLRLDPSAPAYHRDGLTADCLELRGVPLRLARLTMPPARMRWLTRAGLHRFLAMDTARVTRLSAAVCLLTTPAWDRSALVTTGRVLQRVWLLAASDGLTTHPLSALLDCPAMAGPTAEAFGIITPTEHSSPSPTVGRGGLRDEGAPTVGREWQGGRGETGAPWWEGEGFPAAVFRLGYALPAARAPRLPLDELLTARPELS